MPKEEEIPGDLTPLPEVVVPNPESEEKDEQTRDLLRQRLQEFEKLLDHQLSNRETD